MKKKAILISTIIIVAVAVVVSAFIVFQTNTRNLQPLLNENVIESPIIYEDVAAEYMYQAEMEVDNIMIAENTHIAYSNVIHHMLKITDYEGLSHTMGFSVYVDGIPQLIKIEGTDSYFVTFDPTKKTRFRFDLSPISYASGGGKVTVVIFSELESNPIYYLDSTSNYTTAITYWIDDVPAQEYPVLPESLLLHKNCQNETASIIAENKGLSAMISDSQGFTTMKFDAHNSKKNLYLNVYGTEGDYIATAYCDNFLYNAFGESASAFIRVEENDVASIPLDLPKSIEKEMSKVFCVLIPVSRDNTKVFDSVMLNVVKDEQWIIAANNLAIDWNVQAGNTLTDEKLKVLLTTNIQSVQRTYRILALIDGIPQKIEYAGEFSYSFTFKEPVIEVEFWVYPNMSCEYDENFEIDVLLLQDGADSVLSEDYMMDYAFQNQSRTLYLKNQYHALKLEEKNISYISESLDRPFGKCSYNLIFPKEQSNYQNSFCSYFETNEKCIQLSCLFTLPNGNDGKSCLTFVVVNGEILDCFSGNMFCCWKVADESMVFDFNISLKNGLNKIYAVTLIKDGNQIQRLVARSTIKKNTSYCYLNNFAVSYAFNNTSAVFAFQNSGDKSCYISTYMYGYNFDSNYNAALQSPTRNIKIDTRVKESERIQIESISLNTAMISCEIQDGKTFSFAKYKAYGYTN